MFTFQNPVIFVGDNNGDQDHYILDCNCSPGLITSNLPAAYVNPYVLLFLIDTTQTAISSTALPLTPPDVSAYNINELRVIAQSTTDPFGEPEMYFNGHIDAFSLTPFPVPLSSPSTLLCLAIGLGSLSWMLGGRYRKRGSKML